MLILETSLSAPTVIIMRTVSQDIVFEIFRQSVAGDTERFNSRTLSQLIVNAK